MVKWQRMMKSACKPVKTGSTCTVLKVPGVSSGTRSCSAESAKHIVFQQLEH
jgi:hypothetical protein